MTTETWLRPAGSESLLLTRVPPASGLLVRAPGPPFVARAACVEVRPGPVAVNDGEGRRGTIHVEVDGDRRVFPSDDLEGVAGAVAEGVSVERPSVVRFGDRAACRRMLPGATVRALERGLATAVEAGDATLLTWTSGGLVAADRRTYAVVVDGPADDGP